MIKCEFCGKDTEELVMYTDQNGKNYSICNSCEHSVTHNKCIRCHTPNTLLYKGMCLNCIQVNSSKMIAIQEELDNIVVDDGNSEEISDSMFNKWMTNGGNCNSYDKEEMIKLWIIVKLIDSHITDNELIKANINDLETLAKNNINKIRKDCKIVIGSVPEGKTVIDNINNVNLIEA